MAARVLLREADLQHHLSVEDDKSVGDASAKGAKPTEKVIAGPATGKSAAAPANGSRAEPRWARKSRRSPASPSPICSPSRKRGGGLFWCS